MPDTHLPKQLLVCAPVGWVGPLEGRNVAGTNLCRVTRCGFAEDWCVSAQNRSAWQGVVKMSGALLNAKAKRKEDQNLTKDEKKRAHESPLPLWSWCVTILVVTLKLQTGQA